MTCPLFHTQESAWQHNDYMEMTAHQTGSVGGFLVDIWEPIINYRDVFIDKHRKITLYTVFVLIMFPGITISVECLKIDSYSMLMVEIEH